MRHPTPEPSPILPATHCCLLGVVALPSTTEWSAAFVAALIVALALGLFQLARGRKRRPASHIGTTPPTPKPRHRLKIFFAYERTDGDPSPGTGGTDPDQKERCAHTAEKLLPDGAVGVPAAVTRQKE